MLSASAAVAPLRPVLGVWESVDWGTLRRERFCFESPSAAVPVDGSCDDDWPGAKVFEAMASWMAAVQC